MVCCSFCSPALAVCSPQPRLAVCTISVWQHLPCSALVPAVYTCPSLVTECTARLYSPHIWHMRRICTCIRLVGCAENIPSFGLSVHSCVYEHEAAAVAQGCLLLQDRVRVAYCGAASHYCSRSFRAAHDLNPCCAMGCSCSTASYIHAACLHQSVHLALLAVCTAVCVWRALLCTLTLRPCRAFSLPLSST